MSLLSKNAIKYKYLTFDELVINLDRLSRFKNPEESFSRVYYEIISKCLISPKYSKLELQTLPAEYIVEIIQEIWNKSVQKQCESNEKLNKNILKLHILNTFKNLDKKTNIFINAKINILPILNKLDYEQVPLNLKFLIKTSLLKEQSVETLDLNRETYSLKFPIRKLLIVEGITEEILLPVFANKLNLNFDKKGIYILGAGGKSKSPALYLKLRDKLKIPVILLFDADAKEINASLKKVLLKKDISIIIEDGEFEDILSTNLIKRALNNEYKPATPIIVEELRQNKKMCENIEEFYRTRHLGEFKKSKVSKIIAENLKYDTDITNEIKNIIQNII